MGRGASYLCTALYFLAVFGCFGGGWTSALDAATDEVAAIPAAVTVAEAPPKPDYWEQAKEQMDRRVTDLLAQHAAEVRKGVRYRKILHGDLRRRQVALTFDDGPHHAFTPQLLAILQRYQVHATFFVVGEKAQQGADLVRAELAAGHSIGNHTFHHVNLTLIPDSAVATEIAACGEVLQSITGRMPVFFRPPGGDYNRRVAEVAEALGYTMALWTDNPGDYTNPGEPVIVRRVMTRLGNGAIILLHDGVQETVDMLPTLIEALKAKHYEFVTLDEIMAARAKKKPG